MAPVVAAAGLGLLGTLLAPRNSEPVIVQEDNTLEYVAIGLGVTVLLGFITILIIKK